MKNYELSYVITPEISPEEAEVKANEIATLIKNNGGSILGQTNPTAKTLAYPIQKRASGFFGTMELTMEPENVEEFSKQLTKDEKVIRKMLTVKSKIRIKKEKRTASNLSEVFKTNTNLEKIEKTEEPKEKIKEEPKDKVELKDIEQKLDELLK